MEQFSNAAFWGRHPMPYFKIPRTEKYGMRCASSFRIFCDVSFFPVCSGMDLCFLDSLITAYYVLIAIMWLENP